MKWFQIALPAKRLSNLLEYDGPIYQASTCMMPRIPLKKPLAPRINNRFEVLQKDIFNRIGGEFVKIDGSPTWHTIDFTFGNGRMAETRDGTNCVAAAIQLITHIHFEMLQIRIQF